MRRLFRLDNGDGPGGECGAAAATAPAGVELDAATGDGGGRAMKQLDFLTEIAPTVTVSHARGATLAEQFAAFHGANPHVYGALRRLALGMVRRGRRRIAIKMLIEVLRWQHDMTTADAFSEFKINNSYAPFYARLLMDTEPELVDVFELRTQTWQLAELN